MIRRFLPMRCRSAFVLPMALFITFLALVIVGASAKYCATEMSTSNLYLSRTRCRLAAQSAIEKTKILIKEESNGEKFTSEDAANGNKRANLGGESGILARVKSSTALAEMVEEFHERDPNLRVAVDLQSDQNTYVNRILATAELKKGGRTTTVTLQECFEVPLSDANIFLYAYFINGDGHLISRYLKVNGDVRANADFIISAANINGFVYAGGEAEIDDTERSWFDSDNRYATIRTKSSYNSAFRSDTYAKARPTNPLGNGTDWEGGFEPSNSDSNSGLTLRQIIEWLKELFNGSNYDDGEMRLNLSRKTEKGDKVVSENYGELKMPKIKKDSESETDIDKHLSHYKNNAASSATPKGFVGGSLICSNCYLNADGEVTPICVKVKADIPAYDEEETRTISETNTSTRVVSEAYDELVKEAWDEVKIIQEAYTTTKTAASQIPSDGVPVYAYQVVDDSYNGPSGWTKLTEGYGNGNSGEMMFDLATFNAKANEHYAAIGGATKALEIVRSKGWSTHLESDLERHWFLGYYWEGADYYYNPNAPIGYVRLNIEKSTETKTRYIVTYEYHSFGHEADYEGTSEKMLAQKAVALHQYSSSKQSGWTKITSSWFSDNYGYRGTSGSFNNYFCDESELYNAVYALNDDYDDRFSVESVWNYFSGGKNGWKHTTSGYYNKTVSGYLVIQYWRRNKNGTVSYETVCNFQTTNPGTYDPTIAAGGTVPSGSIPVYAYKSSLGDYDNSDDWESIYYDSDYYYRNTLSTSEYYNYIFYKPVLNTVASNCHKTYPAVSENTIKNLFAKSSTTGWDGGKTGNGYRSKNPIGYITIVINPEYYNEDRYDATYEFKTVSDLTIEVPAVTETIHHEAEYKHHDEVTEQVTTITERTETGTVHHDAQVGAEVTRELRRVFVKGGYKLVTDKAYTPTGATATLLRPEDLILRDGLSMANGDTTEKLTPFAEDSVLKLNKAHAAGGVGGKSPDQGAVILIGTWDFPIVIDGSVVFESDVLIRGFVTGRGTIYSGRNIHIIGDINYKNPPFWPETGDQPNTKGRDMLILISRGSIVIGNYVWDDLWKNTSNGLIAGNYINAQENSTLGIKYTTKDYTKSDTDYRKITYNYVPGTGSGSFTLNQVPRYYESVVGDYVFTAKFNIDNTMASESDSLSENGCFSPLSQYWDANLGTMSTEMFLPSATFQSGLIEAYANYKNWDSDDRVGKNSKTFLNNFLDPATGKFMSDYRSFCKTKYSSYNGTSLPHVECIGAINSILYSSEGIYGVVGGNKTPCVINGAVIGQEEALLPFAKNRTTFFGTKSSDLSITINWDIRLNLNSAEAKANDEDGTGFANPMSAQDLSNGEPGDPRVLSWQEVPDDFNTAYTP